jgi:hypothetical protein
MDRKSQLSLTGNEWREEKNWTRILPTMRGSKSSTKGKKKRRKKTGREEMKVWSGQSTEMSARWEFGVAYLQGVVGYLLCTTAQARVAGWVRIGWQMAK